MKRRKQGHMLLWSLGLWVIVIAILFSESVFHVLGWIAATVVLTGSAYALGRRQASPRPAARKLAANSKYGAATAWGNTPRAYRGGSLPRDTVTDMDVVSAYPPELTVPSPDKWAEVRTEVASGLANLGWPARTTGPVITQAISRVRVSGEEVTTANVLASVLRQAGDIKAQRTEP
jgi:hypothetical protein